MRSACFPIRLGSVAIGAADLALLYLGYHPLEGYVLTAGIANIELFVPDVVELKDDGIGFTTVYAGVILQILV